MGKDTSIQETKTYPQLKMKATLLCEALDNHTEVAMPLSKYIENNDGRIRTMMDALIVFNVFSAEFLHGDYSLREQPHVTFNPYFHKIETEGAQFIFKLNNNGTSVIVESIE